jgi:hypothetical protein
MIQDSNAPSDMQPWVRQTEAEMQDVKNKIERIASGLQVAGIETNTSINSALDSSFTFTPQEDGTIVTQANAIDFIGDITSSASVNVDGSITVGSKPEYKEGQEGPEIIGSAPYFEITPGASEVNPVTGKEFFAPGTFKINDTSLDVNGYGKIAGNGLSIFLSNDSDLMGYSSAILDIAPGVIYVKGSDWVEGEPEDEVAVTVYEIALNETNLSIFLTGAYVDVAGVDPTELNFTKGLIVDTDIDELNSKLYLKFEVDNSVFTYVSGGQVSLNSASEKNESIVSISGPGGENDYSGSRVSQYGVFVGPNGGSEYEAPSSLQASGLVTPIVNAKEKLIINDNGLFVQANQPTSPSDGDLWINPDAASEVWNVSSELTKSIQEITSDIESLTTQLFKRPVSHNYILNGGMDIWQRGTSFAGTGYSADRWLINNNSTTTRDTSTPNNLGFSLKTRRTSGSGAFVGQRIESFNSQMLANKTVTISWWAKEATADGNSTMLTLRYADAVDDFSATTDIVISPEFTLSTNWQKFTFTTVLPEEVKNGLLVQFGFLALSKDFFLAEVQLEEGGVTDFKRNAPSIQAELAACQRYYTRFGQVDSQSRLCFGVGTPAGTLIRCVLSLPVNLRVRPSAIEFGGSGFFFADANTQHGFSGFLLSAATSAGVVSFDCTGASGVSNFRTYFLVIPVNGFVAFSAEL